MANAIRTKIVDTTRLIKSFSVGLGKPKLSKPEFSIKLYFTKKNRITYMNPVIKTANWVYTGYFVEILKGLYL